MATTLTKRARAGGVTEERLQSVVSSLSARDDQVTEWVTSQIAEAHAEIDETRRITSTPVPPVVMTKDYAAVAADQRIIHVSLVPHTLTPPDPRSVYPRRNIIENIARGSLTVLGTFHGANPDGTGLIVDPVLKAGEGFDYLGFFLPDPAGDEDAPADLLLNGQPPPAGTKGFYRLKIVSQIAKLPPEEIRARFDEVEAATAAALNLATQANNRTFTKASVGLASVDNTPDAQKPVSVAQSTAIEQRALAVIALLRGGVEAAGATLGKLSARVLALHGLITHNQPHAALVVNRVAEILEVFQSYPEGVRIVDELSKKVNVTDVVNALTETVAGRVLDARQGKVLADSIALLQTRSRVLYADFIPGTPINAASAAEQFFPLNVTLPAHLITPNRVFDLDVRFLVTTVTGAPTMTFRIRVGGGAVLLASAALNPGASRTNQLVRLTARFGGVSAGTLTSTVKGAVEGQGEIWFSSTTHFPMTNTATIAIDTRLDNGFQLSVLFGTAAGASHFIQRRSIVLVSLN